MTINTVAIAAMMKADPHKTSAKILRCWSHESNRRHPTSAEVNTIMATNVGKSNTMTTTDAEILGKAAGMSAGLRTLPLRCYRGLKLHILFEPNAMRQKKKGGRSRPKLQAFVRLLRIVWLVLNADLLGQILCEDHVGR